MNAETNREEDQGQSLFDALSNLAKGQELKVVIGNSSEAGAVHLVIPRALLIQTQTAFVAHLSRSG